jgi:hypothetical protein
MTPRSQAYFKRKKLERQAAHNVRAARYLVNLQPQYFSKFMYVLEGRVPRPARSIHEWSQYMETAERHVADTQVGDARVSTVFLGTNNSFGFGPPLLFETMIFGGKYDDFQRRYCTWEEAEQGHQEACALVTSGTED